MTDHTGNLVAVRCLECGEQFPRRGPVDTDRLSHYCNLTIGQSGTPAREGAPVEVVDTEAEQ